MGTIVLSNLVALGEVDKDLEWETAEEMSKIGRVAKCSIEVFNDAIDEEAVQISVEFETFEDAAKALAAFNGRIFGKREVTARYYEDGYQVKKKSDLESAPAQDVDALEASGKSGKARAGNASGEKENTRPSQILLTVMTSRVERNPETGLWEF